METLSRVKEDEMYCFEEPYALLDETEDVWRTWKITLDEEQVENYSLYFVLFRLK